MGEFTSVLLAVVLVLANAFFVGAEFALISARRSQIEPLADSGSGMARTTLKAMESLSLVIGVNQLGITIASLLLGAIAEPAISHLVHPVLVLVHTPEGLLHPISFTLALLVVVFLHVVLGEMIPKNLALANPERAALLLGPPIWTLVVVLRPVILGFNAVAAVVLRMLGAELRHEVSSSYTREEVAAMVEESHGEGVLQADEYDRLAGALGFVEKTIDQVVLPPEQLTVVRRGATPEDVEELCAATGYSRFPVLDDAGGLPGYLHLKDVLETDEQRRRRVIDDKWIRPFATVRRGDLLHDALAALRQRGAHMGRVIDDDGTLLGVITLEDVLEELVGEIRDAAHNEESV